MSEIIFQIISADGQMVTKHLDWQGEGSVEMMTTIEKTIDVLPEDKKVFVIVDLYSEYKERKQKPSEKIIEEDIKKVTLSQDTMWKEAS